MPPGEQVVEDYRHLSLSLKAHPVSFLRPLLAAKHIVRCEDLARPRQYAAVAGLVLVRQRPGTANGVIFMTLEDETGIANAIVWPKVFEQNRAIVLGARFLSITGRVQNAAGVIHIVAERFEDLTPMLSRLSQEGPRLSSLANADELRRPQERPKQEDRPKQDDRARQQEAAQRLALAAEAAVMPRGRNFH
jgi:hypothetical protein